jgi:tRNA A-37 threonylcarbamoyl transferase component Bud32
MAESSPSSGDSLIGRTVAGRYRVISKLGEGGMGLTYRAWDEAEGRPVVLKMPRRNLVENAAFLERFSREVRMMAALSHPSIVPILDVGEDEGLPILVMRFLPGGSLSNRRLRDADGKVQPTQPSTLQLWLPAVASALDFVHANGIVHRDVKPANIFFDAFWGAYLGDFGIAKIVEDTTVLEKEHTLTATSMAIGTQEYMAPEQFTPKAVVDGRVDQYALAVMVYEILVGQRPFRGETAHLVVEVTTQPVPRLTQFRRELPDSVCHAVYRGLSKQPGERFASCAEFAQAVLRDVRPMADEEGIARLLCPQCGNMLKMPTSAAGRQGKCPRCKTEMMVAEDLGALWLAREEHEEEEQAAAGAGEQKSGVDSVDVFTSISSTTPMPKAGVRGIWSQLDPTVRRVGIGAAILASLVATALLAGDYAAGAARKQLEAATASQKKLLAENQRLEREVRKLVSDNTALNSQHNDLLSEMKVLTANSGKASSDADAPQDSKRAAPDVPAHRVSGGEIGGSEIPEARSSPVAAVDGLRKSPGLIGRITQEGKYVPAGMICGIIYIPGGVLQHRDVAQIVSQGGELKDVRMELKGTFEVSEDCDIVIWHKGGSSSGGVHSLFVDGEELGSIGDDRIKNVTYRHRVQKGPHAVRWVLTGGQFGDCMLQFYDRHRVVIPVYRDAATVAETSPAAVMASGQTAYLGPVQLGGPVPTDDKASDFSIPMPEGGWSADAVERTETAPLALFHLTFSGDWSRVETARGARDVEKIGAPTITDGISGNGLRVGVGSRVEIDLTDVLPLGNSERTVSLWARTHKKAQQNLAAYLSYGGRAERNQAWSVCLGSDAYCFNGNWHDVKTDQKPTLGMWDHIVTVKRGDEIEVWVNGTLRAARAGKTNTVGARMLLGKNVIMDREIEADIDEVAVWDKPLRPREIVSVYESFRNTRGSSEGNSSKRD